MASVNQTRQHRVNKMGQTHSKPLAARHGHSMLCVNRPLLAMISPTSPQSTTQYDNHIFQSSSLNNLRTTSWCLRFVCPKSGHHITIWNTRTEVISCQTILKLRNISLSITIGPSPNLKVRKVKVKVTLVQALRLCTGCTAYRGSRGIALPFHDHGTRRGWGVSFTHRPLSTPGKDPVPIVQEAGWAPGRVWTGEENLGPPPEFDPRTVQPIASGYTDWATRPAKLKQKHYL